MDEFDEIITDNPPTDQPITERRRPTKTKVRRHATNFDSADSDTIVTQINTGEATQTPTASDAGPAHPKKKPKQHSNPTSKDDKQTAKTEHTRGQKVITIYSNPLPPTKRLLEFDTITTGQTGLRIRKAHKKSMTTTIPANLCGKTIFRINNTGSKSNPITNAQAANVLSYGGRFQLHHH